MGYSIVKHKHGKTTRFIPDDTDKEFYINTTYQSNLSLEEVSIMAEEKWPDQDTSYDNINMNFEYIQVACIGHDQYDSSDYCIFMVVSLHSWRE